MMNNCCESSGHPMEVKPKRKKNFYFPQAYPFPIIRDSSDENAPFNCIVGHLKNQCVEVTDEQNMRLLFTMGFFGKGTLSRSTPNVLERHLREEQKKKSSKKINVTITIDLQDGYVDKQVADSTNDNIKVENAAKRRKKDEIEVVLSESDSNDSYDEIIENTSDQMAVTTTVADIKETLQLSLEEAYFLSYGLGVLVVMDRDQPLDLLRLWHKFCEIHPNQCFPAMYTAYHHFRSKGWVVRSGLKYGVDFALYKDGPPFYHSSYAVIVKPVKEQNMRDITPGGRPLTWPFLLGLTRMCSHVSKNVMILYVIRPTSMSENKISTPFCVSQFKLEEVLVNRWVPSANRSNA